MNGQGPQLIGPPASADRLASASALASEGATPLPQSGYKLRLLEGAALDVLERAAGGPSSTGELALGERGLPG